jgi:hypothetical protein
VHVQVSSLLRNELNLLKNGNTLDGVNVLASQIYKLQVEEAGELLSSCFGCVNPPNSMFQSEPDVMQTAPSVMRISVSMSHFSFPL